MCAWIVPPVAGLIEMAVAPEFYSDGETAVEVFGNTAKFWLTAMQMPIDGGNKPQSIVVAKIIKPIWMLPSAMSGIAHCLTGRSPDIQDGGPWPRLVR